jgi:hypothetical protein
VGRRQVQCPGLLRRAWCNRHPRGLRTRSARLPGPAGGSRGCLPQAVVVCVCYLSMRSVSTSLPNAHERNSQEIPGGRVMPHGPGRG